MSEYLRQTADHISWLMRERRGEVADAGRLAARVSRILHRRTRFKGLAGILGADDLKAVAGVLRPKPRPPLEPPPRLKEAPQPAPEPESTPAAEEVPEPASEPESAPAVEPTPHAAAEPEPAPAVEVAPQPTTEPAEAPGAEDVGEIAEDVGEIAEDVGEIAERLEEALEPTPSEDHEAAPAGSAVDAQAVEPMREAASEPEAEEAAEAPTIESPEAPEDTLPDVEHHIREAAVEAAAVEGIRLETMQPAEQEPAEPSAPAAEAAGQPDRATLTRDLPFEAALDPQRLIPADLAFAQAADEVLFRRSIENLGSGDMRGVREGIEMLGRVPDDAAAAVLINLYRIAPPRWRPDVAHQLVGHPGAGIASFFCTVLDDEDEPAVVRGAALRGLYSRDRTLAADYLLKALGDSDEDVRATAATYLGWLREKRAIPLLEQLLGDSSQHVAKAALHAASLIQR